MDFTQEEITLRAEFGKGFTDTQWGWVVSECRARNLRIGSHLVPQLRRAKEYDSTTGAYVFVSKPFLITTIAALRLVAQRTGEYAGQAPEEYVYIDKEGLPNVVSNVPLPDPENKTLPREPWVVRTKVYRKGFTEPMIGIARFEAYAGMQKTQDGKWRLTDMWAKRGPEQLAKCSEALSLRKAFPEEMSNLFLSEEIRNEEEAPPPTEPVALAPAPSAPSVPKVDHTPAVPTIDPRPGEEIPTLEEIVLDKPAGTLPKRPGRKPKAEIPVNGKLAHDRPDLGITDEDIANAHKPKPEFDEAANKAEAEAFVEDVCNATPVPDRVPDTEQKKVFADRIRTLATDGVTTAQIGAWAKKLTGKEKSGDWTNGDWGKIFAQLDAAAQAGTLKELVKQ